MRSSTRQRQRPLAGGGRVRSDDGVLDTPLAHPEELADPVATRPTPSSSSRPAKQPVTKMPVLRIAREGKAPILDLSVTAHVGLSREADGYFRLTVALEVSVPRPRPGGDRGVCRIAHEKVCPYSRATRGNIHVNVTVI